MFNPNITCNSRLKPSIFGLKFVSGLVQVREASVLPSAIFLVIFLDKNPEFLPVIRINIIVNYRCTQKCSKKLETRETTGFIVIIFIIRVILIGSGPPCYAYG